MIKNPTLPPRKGYVEVIDENGNHMYKPTLETAAVLEQEAAEKAAQGDTDALLVDHEYRLTLLELGVAEGV